MKTFSRILAHLFLIFFVILWFIPLYLAVVAASHPGDALMHSPLPIFPGSSFWENLKMVLFEGMTVTGGEPVIIMLLNSFIMAMSITTGKIILALTSAFALIYFDLPGKKILFVLIFSTMMLPVEVRIVPTFQVMASFSAINSLSGLTLPLMASATGTFLFRQFFKSIPNELVDAAKLDGAGPWRFFWDILLPLSATKIASLFIILFIYGWNQYLWPLVSTTDSKQTTIVMGIRSLAGVADQMPQWHYIMCIALLALLPPCLIVIAMQPLFEKGLTHS